MVAERERKKNKESLTKLNYKQFITTLSVLLNRVRRL